MLYLIDDYTLASNTNTETTKVFLIMKITNRSQDITIIQKDLFILFVLSQLPVQANIRFAANKNLIFNHFSSGCPLTGAHQSAEYVMSSEDVVSTQTCDAYPKPNPEHSVSG